MARSSSAEYPPGSGEYLGSFTDIVGLFEAPAEEGCKFGKSCSGVRARGDMGGPSSFAPPKLPDGVLSRGELGGLSYPSSMLVVIKL
jgi:hypothetical protein